MGDVVPGAMTNMSATYFPVATDSIDEHMLEMDLYLKSTETGAPVLYRSTGVAFSNDDRKRLVNLGVRFLYVPTEQHKAYRKVLTKRLDQNFHDPAKSRKERTRFVRTSCAKMIEDVLLFPGQHVSVAMVEDVAEQFAKWAAEEDGEFAFLLDMSAHDYYTVTHLVNVGVACGLLIRELRPGQPEMYAPFIQGGLLHDIGKRKIPEWILNKVGQLKPREWELIHDHPMAGYAELAAHSCVSPIVLEMVRDHHEKLDGTGYASGLSGEQVGFPARLCAVVDMYDAIASSRPYRGPTPPRETLRLLNECAGVQLDPGILKAWERVIERLLQRGPDDVVPERSVQSNLRLDDLMPAAPAPKIRAVRRGTLKPGDDEVRQYERLGLHKQLRVRLVRQYKACPVALGVWFHVRTVDISQGGVQLQTPFPLTMNDVVEIEFSADEDKQNPLGCVVRIRQDHNNEWFAGVKFVDRDED